MSETIQIPKGWVSKKLAEISDVKRGYSWSKSQESITPSSNSIPVLRIGNIKERNLDLTSLLHITELKKEIIEKNKVSKNDILLVGSNGNKKWVGRSCKIDKDMDFIYASFLMGIHNVSKDIDPDFLFYYLNSPQGWNHIRSSTSSGVGINNLKITLLREMSIIFPKDLKIQKQIVAKLDHILGELEVKKKEIISLIEQNKERINFFEKNWINYIISTLIPKKEIPNGWSLLPLSEICNVERGKFGHRPRNDPAFYGGKYPFIQTGDVARSNGRVSKFSQTLNEKGFKVSRMFPKGTVVITISANIGDTAILEFDSCFPDSLIGITPITGKTIAEYVEYALRLYQKDLTRDASQGTQKNINYDFLKPLLIPVPKTITEQENIVRKIKSAEEKFQSQKKQFENIKNNYESKINYINHIQSSVLDSAFSGKLLN